MHDAVHELTIGRAGGEQQASPGVSLRHNVGALEALSRPALNWHPVLAADDPEVSPLPSCASDPHATRLAVQCRPLMGDEILASMRR
ncbi:hypothetical protein [Streptomyces mirabilis]|uniref:hypothetical protein n=1 Tax=Streptomyces mirabilis TaxID=68239 RepID=UPI003817CE30